MRESESRSRVDSPGRGGDQRASDQCVRERERVHREREREGGVGVVHLQ